MSVAGAIDGKRQESSALSRIAAVAAVAGAIALVAALFFSSNSSTYEIKARFQNAGQLVKGNFVEVGGTKAGEVTGFRITPDGQAEVDLEIDEKYRPLRVGTRAVIRAGSLSSTSNRYVELFLPGEREAGGDIPDGGVLTVDRTTANVEIDQFFNVLDPETRRNLRGFYRGLNRAYTGRGEEANRGLLYLSPQLAASTRLFEELRHDPPVLERFLVDSSRLVTSLAARRDDLAALIANLNSTTRALGTERVALAEAIQRFPGFLRTANTTYVNLRATLDELDPFVAASKPVARRLQPYLRELRPFARDARPAVRDLRALLRSPGRENDVLELQRAYPPLADIALVTRDRSIDFGTGAVDVGETRGAFPELTEALTDSTPIIAHGRPYTTDFLGWMDDFSHTGAYDALGSFSRAQTYFNAFSVNENAVNFIPLEDRGTAYSQIARTGQFKRCPGGAEVPADDGSNVLSEEQQRELDCTEAHRATGALP